MENIKWGIIGCGDVTEIKSGPAFNKVGNSTLVAVMRRNSEMAMDYARRHNVPKWYENAGELINDPDVNAIYVATPPSSHEFYALAALEAGKPVYIEKPMATDAAAAARIADAAHRSGIKMSVAHYRRQLPLFKKIKELLDSSYIGKVRFINLQLLQSYIAPDNNTGAGNWRVDPSISGGGLFHDLAPHQLDLLLYFFGEPVNAVGTSLNQAGFYSADDIVNGTMHFKNDILLNGLWCFTVPESEARDICEIIGSEGSLRFSIFKMQHLSITRNGRHEELFFEALPHVQQPMIKEVVGYFSNEGPNPCSADDGVIVMQMIDSFTGHPNVFNTAHQ